MTHALAITALILSALVALPAVEPAPYGGDDFYPSADRPVGFRGDGSGWFSGARPVTSWWEGTPRQERQQFKGKRGMEEGDAWVFADAKRHNIVWKTQLPAWANGHPVVVGNRVFCLGEPDYLFCLDAESGEVLWTQRCNPWLAAGVEVKKAERLQTLYDIYEDGVPLFDKMTSGGTTSDQVHPTVFKEILDLFLTKDWPGIKAALAQLAPGPDYQALLDADVKSIQEYFAQYDSGKRPKVRSELRGRIGKEIGSLSPVAVPIDVPWGHMVGWCASVPVSDGERVYASFGQGGILCCDLDGKVQWMAFSEPGDRGGTTTQTLQAPLLCDGVLIDARGKHTLRGLDTRTGKQLWEAPTMHPDAKKGSKGGYYVGNHAIVPLKHPGGVMKVLVTTMCNLIRPSDGRLLGYLPWPHDYGPSGGPSVLWCGNRVYRVCNGDGGGCPFTGYELTVASPDRVEAKISFTLGEKGSPGYQGQVCTPEYLLLSKDEHAFLSPDGSRQVAARKFGGLSNVQASNTFIWHENGDGSALLSSWGGRRAADGRAFMTFHLRDVTDPTNPKPIDGMRLLGGENPPRVPAMERWAPATFAHPAYWGQCYGKPAHLIHTDTAIFPMANRLFIKTVGHCYSVGDPKQAYSWNPASRK